MAFHTRAKVDDTIVEERTVEYNQPNHDLESIGKHCCVCQMKDFLPFNCTECKNIYCKEHWGQHTCKVKAVPIQVSPKKKKQRCSHMAVGCRNVVTNEFMRCCEYCKEDFCSECRSHFAHNCAEYRIQMEQAQAQMREAKAIFVAQIKK